MNILFYGPSGSGKDTQAEFIVENYGYRRISSGDLIRDIAHGPTEIQQLLQKRMNEGFLPDYFALGVLEVYLKEVHEENVIFSGTVRNAPQVELFDQMLSNVGRKLDKVFYFELSDEEAIKRMSGRLYCPVCNLNYHKLYSPPLKVDTCDNCGGKLEQREDDTDEGIHKRLEAFHRQNDHIIQKYKDRGILVTFDASKGIEEVREEVEKHFNDNL
jgi:adenylate kinase